MNASHWGEFPTDLQPVDSETGPFPLRPFLETVWNHREDQAAELSIEVFPDGAVALSVSKGRLSFAGQENLTDYHSPLGRDGVSAVVSAVASIPGITFRLDSMTEHTATAVAKGLADEGIDVDRSQHDVAAVLALPDSYDAWLGSIGKKERHEVRRKRRRFEAEFGEIAVVAHGPEAIDMFSAMHRTSHGDKGLFMTEEMNALFSDLLTTGGAQVHTLVCDGIPRASAFGFETDDGYYYYNSAYDVDAAMASPGIVLLAALVEAQIARGASVFDFLKGDERYKFKHGARPRPLFAIEGRTL